MNDWQSVFGCLNHDIFGQGQAVNYFRSGVLYAKNDQSDQAIAAFGKAIDLEPEKYRAILREELKKVHSVLDSIRYKEAFVRLVNPPTAH